jgi:hypothetical protein
LKKLSGIVQYSFVTRMPSIVGCIPKNGRMNHITDSHLRW